MFNPHGGGGGYFGQFKMVRKNLNNDRNSEYPHDRVLMVINNLFILVLWTKVA